MLPIILIIDDDEDVTKMWRRLLKRDFQVLDASNGPDGIVLLREKQPDAIILDLMMPRMNGWQVCEEIRKFSSIPIIVYSGLGDAETRESIFAKGATRFLTKPASIMEMIQVIRDVLEEKNK